MLEVARFEKKRARWLDFTNERASSGRYGIHEYPAMLHYLVVRSLLDRYGCGKKVLYDPFCGSGVVVCEGLRKKMVAYGTDINPIALLIAQVRTSMPAEPPIEDIKKDMRKAAPDIPEVKNIEYWFKDYVIEDLGKLRSAIKKRMGETYFNLLLVAFSQTVRDVSNNKKNEFKRFRLSEKELEKFNPDVEKCFEKNVMDFYKRITQDPLLGKAHLFKADVREGIPFREKVEIVITSPPYGDSKTTVAYGQFCSFSFDWVKSLNPFGDANLSIDKSSLGGRRTGNGSIYSSEKLEKVCKEIAKSYPRRADEVQWFYSDLLRCCQNICLRLKKKAIVCFVVGNRRVNGIEIPTDEIVKEMFESLGLVHRETLVREITNKRMPLENSPKNIAGCKSPTMKLEYVVVMEVP